MRTLNSSKTLSAIALAVLHLPCFGLESEMVYQIGTNPNLDLGINDSKLMPNSNVTFSLNGYKLSPHISGASTIGLKQFKPSALGFLDENQEPIYSEQLSRMETSLQSSLIYQSGNFGHEVGLATSAPANLIKSQRIFGSHTLSLFNLSTLLSFEWTLSHIRPPLSYYLDFDLQVKARPAIERGQEIAFSYEQTLSQSVKTRAKVFHLQKFQTRPQAVGVDLAIAVAMNPQWIFKMKGSLAQEKKSEALKNERGYFDLKGASIDLSFEPRYRNEYNLTFFTQIERENNPQNQSLRRYGVDGFKVSSSFPLLSSDLSTALTFAKNNSQQKLLQFSLGFRRTL